MTIAVFPIASAADWEAARAVRLAVFVDEQGVPADLEMDALDATARHWVAQDGTGGVIGTARAVPLADGTWKIGRVAVIKAWRGRGVGAAVMRAIMRDLVAAGAPGAYLESQTHAATFYAKLGFVAEGEAFMEAGIPHVAMRWTPTA